eukprot:TRINITY_DN3663_c0_g1_i1.p2 TRINITY_DN3663_c0_g1~~TRINITY_DN3663_c0_g1_i1.p2  ORF type:complete len:299 (+),score=23.04 TRINITY_DN3663_c0_g1_i1:256-1152(+)
MIKNYESMIIIEPALSEDEAVVANEKIAGYITEQGGEVVKTDKWGRRKLAYEINKKKEGYYFVNYFTFENLKIKDLDRFYRLNENIVRHNIIRIDDQGEIMAKELRFPYLNTVTISGRLTRDIELRYTSKGTPVAQLSIAFNRRFQDGSGEWREETSFIDVVVWSKQAEVCANQLSKGSAIIVDGYLQTRNYQTKDGQNRRIVEIVAQKIHQLEWNGREQGGANKTDNRFDGYEPFEDTNNSSEEYNSSTNEVTDDDVPFQCLCIITLNLKVIIRRKNGFSKTTQSFQKESMQILLKR